MQPPGNADLMGIQTQSAVKQGNKQATKHIKQEKAAQKPRPHRPGQGAIGYQASPSTTAKT
jgi:hypothetical protein